ncbi:MAG: 50S ribosomal protein L4 [Alkaliphilus sp.]
MPKIAVYNISGEQVSEMELSENIFGAKINEHVLYEVVKNQLANKRQGTQSAKTRSEVRGGGRKPWKQKGTGRARHGTIRSPLWTGGGVVFAPKPRDYSYTIPKKIKRLALKSALSAKVTNNEMIILEDLSFDAPRTKDMVNILKNLGIKRKALIVMSEKDDMVIRSANNIPGVVTALANTINVYDILKYDNFIITKAAVEKVEEVYV